MYNRGTEPEWSRSLKFRRDDIIIFAGLPSALVSANDEHESGAYPVGLATLDAKGKIASQGARLVSSAKR